MTTFSTGRGARPSPVALRARLDEPLSRWLWLVKWLLVLPHVVVLAGLWALFGVLTLVAGVVILFTGEYPRGIFELNVGIIRWTWRVGYYAGSGGLGTDRYPPFSLREEPGDPATLDIDPPGPLNRGLWLVKWLLLLPHWIVVGLLTSSGWGWTTRTDDGGLVTRGGGVLTLLVVVAGVVLLVTGSYPRGLFDLVVGLNRWVFRVLAYAALMTDEYPPFRFDLGEGEPGDDGPAPPAPATPTVPDDRPRGETTSGPTGDATPAESGR